jgi:hypothetical protein
MKKYLLLFLFSVQLGFATEKDSIVSRFHFQKFEFDCDACGCSANGGSMGFSSMFNNNFVGVRYFYQSYTSKDGIFNNSPWVDEDFNTVQAWARIPITRKIQISALVPYHFHTRERRTGDENIKGLGDITVLAMYNIYETTRDSTVFTHKFQVGGGIKIPTGKYDSENNKGSVNPGFQVGTGSWDYMLAAEYVLKKDKIGLNTMLTYTFKTENEKLYQFGNQFNYGATLFYLIEKQSLKLVPQFGIAGEVFESNHQYEQLIPDSAGDIVFGRFGLEAGRKDFSIGVNAMLPINQNLSNGKVESNYRWSVNLNYSL